MRLLIAEDEVLIAMQLEVELEELGCEIASVTATLDETRAKVAGGGFDAAILDIDLCGEDVFPAAHDLARRGIPFVFYSGHALREDIAEHFPDHRVFSKPTPVRILLDAVSG